MTASRRHHEPLPLEVRRVLWRRVWDRLLAPPPLTADRNDTGPADLNAPDQRPDLREGDQ
jgi:hypothetical protein